MAALPSRTKNFNAALNGYRGLCAMLVFVFHIGSAGIMAWPSGSAAADAVTYLWSSLTYGVEMFFMISGFVILASLLRHRSIGGFLHDRVARIFSAWIPALCAVTVMCLLLQIPPLKGLSPAEAGALFLGNVFLLPPIVRFPMIHQVSWSLSYEWVFYLTAAMGLFLYRRSSPRHALLALWLTLGALFIMLFPRALFFVTGVLVFKYRDWFAARAQWLRFPLVSLLVFLVAWRATGAFCNQAGYESGSFWQFTSTRTYRLPVWHSSRKGRFCGGGSDRFSAENSFLTTSSAADDCSFGACSPQRPERNTGRLCASHHLDVHAAGDDRGESAFHVEPACPA